MKKLIFFSLLQLTGLMSNKSIAQISFNRDSITFNTCSELITDSVSVRIYNNSYSQITIENFKFFNTYKSKPFFVKNFNPTILNAGDSLNIYVYFNPKHNIYHNSEMMVQTIPSIHSKTIDLRGQGTYSIAYYTTTQNKSEEDLKTTLKNIITNGYVSLGYNDGRDKMFMIIDNQKVNGQGASVNSLECVYTGKKSLAYTSRTESQTNDNFNTEHTFPQGFFSQNEPMRSDLHHLFPTNDAANNSRSNFAFGVATTPYVNDAINNPSHLGSNSLYEPRDVQKGRTARAMMYFVLRYQDYTNFFASQENILREWHQKFPPNSVDKKRNIDIQTYQKNRNPFVDYPEFADRISKLVAVSTAPIVNSVYWLDTVNFETKDTTDFVNFNFPIVNNGNQSMSAFGFSSIDSDIKFNTLDTIKINAGESSFVSISVNTKNRLGNYSSNISFNTNFASGANFILQYKIDSLTSGVNNTNRKSQFKVYPNPSSSDLFLEINNKSNYEIFNLLSEKVSSGQIDIGLNKINISSLKSGVYFIKVDGAATKFIKQ